MKSVRIPGDPPGLGGLPRLTEASTRFHRTLVQWGGIEGRVGSLRWASGRCCPLRANLA